MDWNAVLHWVAQTAVPLVITAGLIAAWPQIHKLLELHIGLARLATIESVLGAGVRLAEQQLPGADGAAKKEFVVTWGKLLLAAFHITLPLEQIADMIEAAYVKEKMAGLKMPALTAETLTQLTPVRVAEAVNGSTLSTSTAQTNVL